MRKDGALGKLEPVYLSVPGGQHVLTSLNSASPVLQTEKSQLSVRIKSEENII